MVIYQDMNLSFAFFSSILTLIEKTELRFFLWANS